jgi:hypothetical protein
MFVSLGQQALGAWSGRAEILQGCAVLGGVVSKAEMVQGRGLQPSEKGFLQGCAGLAVWPSRMEIVYVCISSMAALGMWTSRAEITQDCAGLGGMAWWIS